MSVGKMICKICKEEKEGYAWSELLNGITTYVCNDCYDKGAQPFHTKKYSIKIGRYGAYFYDFIQDKSLDLNEVLDLLNELEYLKQKIIRKELEK